MREIETIRKNDTYKYHENKELINYVFCTFNSILYCTIYDGLFWL